MYPFKVLESAAKEIFNFMYVNTTVATVFIKRGTTTKIYYNIMSIYVLNVKSFTITSYGDLALPNPRVFMPSFQYLWPDSTLFSLSELSNNLTYRQKLGDISTTEAAVQISRVGVLRSNFSIIGIDF